MAEWIPLTTYADGNILPVDTFQAMWNNLYTLKNKEIEQYPNPGPDSVNWSTTSTAPTPIDTIAYRGTFETFGGDLLICAGFEVSSAADRDIYIHVRLDGVLLGNSDGLFFYHDAVTSANLQETMQLVYYVSPLAAGSHTLIFEFETSDALYTAIVRNEEALGFFVMELM